MTGSSLFRRKDAALWTIAALTALCGVIVGAGLRSSPSDAAARSPVVALAAGPSDVSPAADMDDAALDPAGRFVAGRESSTNIDRVALFRARSDTLHAMEAALRRAFLPRSPPARRRPLPVAASPARRVARGSSPEACLAQAVYYEARGEPEEGQAAVAQVVLNRARSGRHPSDLCGVVFEGAARPGCQFSFACDGRLGGRRLERSAWLRAEGVAQEALAGRGRADLDGALNYHADTVRPRWAGRLQRTAEIGRHIFYSAARPVTRALAGWTFTPAPPSAGA